MLNKYYDKRKIRSWNLFFSVCDTPFVIIIGKRCSISIYFDRYDFFTYINNIYDPILIV